MAVKSPTLKTLQKTAIKYDFREPHEGEPANHYQVALASHIRKNVGDQEGFEIKFWTKKAKWTQEQINEFEESQKGVDNVEE